LPEFAAQSTWRNRPRRDELRIIRTTPAPDIAFLRGLPIVSTSDVLVALARDLGVLDTVVLLDSALHSGDISRAELERALATRRLGVRRLRDAAALADGRSESPYETLLRILHVMLEVPVTAQYELRVDGLFIARGDLRVVGHQVFHEFDGVGHRDRDRHRRDLQRDRDLDAHGWHRRGYTDLEVLRQPVKILRDLDRTLGRAHDPARLDGWYGLLRESCFTSSGQQRLLRRLGLPGDADQPAA
jgi:hypothetical protein